MQNIKRVGVVGSGAMGRGIAQICAQAGLAVVLMDADAGIAQSAQAAILKALEVEVSKGRLSQENGDSAASRLSVTDTLDGLADVDVVIEAITEDLDAKRGLFAELEKVVGDTCILASNTSSLSITLLAADCKKPERVAGMHFFNPVPRMRLVEVIQALRTDSAVIDQLEKLGKKIGKDVVRVQDTPGFLVNQVGRGYTLEAVNIVGEGVATFAQVDEVMRAAVGFRMGPFELLDLVGLDVNHPATEMIYSQFYHEPRYRPSPLMEMRVGAGALGRKAKEGYYSYSEESGQSSAAQQKAVSDVPVSDPGAAPATLPKVWVSAVEPNGGQMTSALVERLGATLETGAAPSDEALCIVTPVGRDASHAAAAQGLDPTRTIAIDTLFGLDKHRTLMATCVTGDEWKASARTLFSSDGVPVTVIRDSPGFIAQRIVAMIMNIGGALAQSRTALPADVDRAVTLGLAYPHGPLAFANLLGPINTGKLLTGLYESFDDPRYRPSQWLKRRSVLNLDFCDGE